MIQKKEKEHTVLPFRIKEEEASSYSEKNKIKMKVVPCKETPSPRI